MSELIHEKRDPSPSSLGSSPLTATTSGGLNTLLLDDHLAPEDSYYRRGDGGDPVYWADLPSGERRRWINSQASSEAKAELKVRRRL